MVPFFRGIWSVNIVAEKFWKKYKKMLAFPYGQCYNIKRMIAMGLVRVFLCAFSGG